MTHHRPTVESLTLDRPVTGRYVYGVIHGAMPRVFSCPAVGVPGGRVHTISEGELSAVISVSPLVVYEPSRENLAAHEHVLATVMRESTLIPFPFGTVLRSEDEVVDLLRSSYLSLVRGLQRLQDKLEIELKVLWDRSLARETLERESERIRTLKAEVERRVRGSTYYARARLRREMETELRGQEDRLVAEIASELRSVSVASRSARPLGERVIMSATFLVDREGAPAFDEKLREISARYQDLLTFRYGAPSPPHSFLNVRLELERAE